MSNPNARRRRRLADMRGWRCHWCDQPTRFETGWMDTATIEHMVPVSQGGTNEPWNLTSSCRRCNSLRGATDMVEFELVARRLPPDARTVAEYELECRRLRRRDRRHARSAARLGTADHLVPGSRAHRWYMNHMAREGVTVVVPTRWSWAWLRQEVRSLFEVDEAYLGYYVASM